MFTKKSINRGRIIEGIKMEKLDTSEYKHFHMVDTLVDILTTKTQNPDRTFFTILACYHLTKVASMMRASVNTPGIGKTHISFYGINCAPSGYGKGHSTKIIENSVLKEFRKEFMQRTFKDIAEQNLHRLAIERARINGTDDQLEFDAVAEEYKKTGKYLPVIDSGTIPALKQLRHKLLMANVGSINLEVDEMANNLLNSKDILDGYLELFDGVLKPKLIKNTKENIRDDEILGITPTNMMLFGSSVNLLDGSQNEKQFMAMLATGYGRRCFFGYSSIDNSNKTDDVKARIKLLTDTTHDQKLSDLSAQLVALADPLNVGMTIKVPESTLEMIVEYQIYCEKLALQFKPTDEIRKTEATSRHYKAIRLAGAFAFLDMSLEMKASHWEAAVKVAELSAESLNALLTVDKTHVRLAKYLASCKEPLTYAELVEELTYFPKAANHQKDLIKLAIAYGHKNNIIIKRLYSDDIELIHGEALQETDIDSMMLSWTVSDFDGVSSGFNPEYSIPFKELSKLTTLANGHWCSHHFEGGVRQMDKALKGFNLLVLDVDAGTPLTTAKDILSKYTYHIYTTKSHQVSKDGSIPCDRYRIVLPMSHKLMLSKDEYKEFMKNVHEYLPFTMDTQTGQNNRKWASNANAQVFNNSGELFDVLPFIPKTKKNEERKTLVESIGSMDALEKYFYQEIKTYGCRNNNLYRFGALLVDGGYSLGQIETKLIEFNKQLINPIDEERLKNTVLKSLANKYAQRI